MSSNPDQTLDDRKDVGNEADKPFVPSIIRDLSRLVESGAKYSTIYADPPWHYSNTVARGAAENHYRTMTLEAIRSEPVKTLVAEKAHLRSWTTNAFLREAFDAIRAWGLAYKSCLI